MTDLNGIRNVSAGGPVRLIPIKTTIDKVVKDILGLKLNRQFKAASNRFKITLLKASKDSEETKRKLETIDESIQALYDKQNFHPGLLKEDEIVTTVEAAFKILLGLPEEATRDEIKEAIKPYLQ